MTMPYPFPKTGKHLFSCYAILLLAFSFIILLLVYVFNRHFSKSKTIV